MEREYSVRMEEEIQIEVILSKKQRQELEQLLEECKREDQEKFDFFMEQEWNEVLDCPCFFLLYKRGQLACAVSAFLAEGEAEISAVTRGEWRKKGLFSRVLRKGIAVLREYGIQEIFFRISDRNQAALEVLEHWTCKLVREDCLMVLSPEGIEGWLSLEKDRGEVCVLGDLEISERKQRLKEIHASAFGCSEEESEQIFESGFSEGMKLWGYWAGNQLIGLCFVLETGREYFLSGVSICKEEQGKGYGEQFLRKLLVRLQGQGRKAVLLQVSGENDRAVRLYRKIGFLVQQRLVTYRMDRWIDK